MFTMKITYAWWCHRTSNHHFSSSLLMPGTGIFVYWNSYPAWPKRLPPCPEMESCGYSFRTNSRTSPVMTGASLTQVTYKVLSPWMFPVSNFCQPEAHLLCLIPASCTCLKPGAELPFLFRSVIFLLIFLTVKQRQQCNSKHLHPCYSKYLADVSTLSQ